MSGVQILAARQKEELHKSILAYLVSADLPKTADALRTELDLGPDKIDENTLKKYTGILEKKWTSVVRLQKKIMDLEAQNAALQSELDTATPTSLNRKNIDPASWLPKIPPRHILTGHRDPVNSVAFHPIFSVLASASEDTSIKIWDWELGELERTLKAHTKQVLDVDFGGPKNQTLLASCSSDLTIKLWDPGNEYNCIRTLTGHDHSVSSVRFIPSAAGNHLVSASRDKTLKVWDVATGYCIKTISGHADWIKSVSPSFDGKFLLSGSSDQTARLWDVSSGEPKATLLGHSHVIEAVAFAPPASYPYLAKIAGLKKPPPPTSSSEFCATAGRDKTICLWDTRGTLLKKLVGHDNWVRALVFHPGGKYLLSVSDDKTIRCWDFEQDGRCVKTVEAHEHFVSCIRWAPSNIKEVPQANGTGTPRKDAGKVEEQIRCVIATASVDFTVRIFAT